MTLDFLLQFWALFLKNLTPENLQAVLVLLVIQLPVVQHLKTLIQKVWPGFEDTLVYVFSLLVSVVAAGFYLNATGQLQTPTDAASAFALAQTVFVFAIAVYRYLYPFLGEKATPPADLDPDSFSAKAFKVFGFIGKLIGLPVKQ